MEILTGIAVVCMSMCFVTWAVVMIFIWKVLRDVMNDNFDEEYKSLASKYGKSNVVNNTEQKYRS